MDRVDLIAQHMLGDRQRPLIGIPPPLHHLRLKARRLHRLVDRLAAAVHEHRLHPHVVHEHDVVQHFGQRRLVVHDRAADFDDDDFVVKPLDVPQRLHQRVGLVDRDFIDGIFHEIFTSRSRRREPSRP